MLTCETCGQILTSLECKKCQGHNLPDAQYCCYCRASLTEEAPQKKPDKKSKGDTYDLDNRVLCSDESCIGIINERGVCTDCGQPPGAGDEE